MAVVEDWGRLEALVCAAVKAGVGVCRLQVASALVVFFNDAATAEIYTG